MARLIAVDLHRNTHFVVATDADGHELWHRRFPTPVAGEAELLSQMQPGDQVVLEATFGACRLANRLESRGATVRIADPQHARLLGMRGKKTDYRDCRALLEHLRAGTLVLVWRPDAPTREIRQLTRERLAYNQSLVKIKNRIQTLLWDEGLLPPSSLWNSAGQAWLAEQELAPVPRQIVTREWAALEQLTTLKQAQEEELARRALSWPQAQRLMQLPGFGAAAAVMFLGEVGDLNRFPSAKQLVSYAGLDPRVRQSGEQCRRGRISKAGRSPLRWLMVEVAWSHVAAGGPEAARYQRAVAKGKPAQVAIVALARHLLVLAYLLLTREESYRELDAARYEKKLMRLATYRPYPEAEPSGEEAPEEEALSHVDWAAERLKELTGQASPYRAAHPRARPGRRRGRGKALRAKREGGGTAATASARQGGSPALEESDPSPGAVGTG
jgi:transposase